MVEQILALERRVPEGLRPAYRGACFILGLFSGVAGKLFSAAILATLMYLAGTRQGLALFGGLLAVSIVSGAVAGALFGLLQPVQRLGAPGIWLRWAIALFGWLATAVVLVPAGPFSLGEPTFYPFAGVLIAIAAALMVLLDDRSIRRPLPRQFELRKLRERLWATAALRRERLAREGYFGSKARRPSLICQAGARPARAAD